MALRGQTHAADSGTEGTSLSVTGPSGTALGDLILLATVLNNGGAEGTVTDPSGFTAGGSLSPALADININADSAWLHLAVKIAVAGDVGGAVYGTTLGTNSYWAQICAVFSGRVNSSIAAAFNNQGETASGSGSTPLAYNITGLTALAADDIVAFIGMGTAGWGGATINGVTISGYSNNLNTQGTYTYSPALSVISLQNFAGGATGTLASSISATSGSTIYPAAFLLSLPGFNSSVPIAWLT